VRAAVKQSYGVLEPFVGLREGCQDNSLGGQKNAEPLRSPYRYRWSALPAHRSLPVGESIAIYFHIRQSTSSSILLRTPFLWDIPSYGFLGGPAQFERSLKRGLSRPDSARHKISGGWRAGHFACMTCTPSQSGCGNAVMNALQRWIYS
jgi:hypothetical protein